MLKVQEAHDKLKAENERLRTRLAALEAVVASDFAKGSRTGLQYCIGECIKPQVCDVLARQGNESDFCSR